MSLETQQQTPQNWGACNCQHTGIRSRSGCCIYHYRLPEVKLASRQIAIAPQDFDPATRDRFLAGTLIPATWYLQAQRFRQLYRDRRGDSPSR